MQDITSNLPGGFRAIENLDLFGNDITNTPIPVAIKGFPAFLVGHGTPLSVWLAAPESPTTQKWAWVVKDNKSTNLVVTVSVDNDTVRISVGPSMVLCVRKTSENSATMEVLDLRPVGLNVVGISEPRSLKVGTNTMVGAKIIGCVAGIGLG